MHGHRPPHGGVPVELGDEYSLEFVLDAPAGKLQVYVLDDEMEKFVRISATSLELTAKLPGREKKLLFMPVASNATGEKIGDTSLFEAQADWLKTGATFDAELKEIAVGSTSYTNVLFNFPKGSDGRSARK